MRRRRTRKTVEDTKENNMIKNITFKEATCAIKTLFRYFIKFKFVINKNRFIMNFFVNFLKMYLIEKLNKLV